MKRSGYIGRRYHLLIHTIPLQCFSDNSSLRMINYKITPSKSGPGRPESRPSLHFGQTYNYKGRFLAMRIRNKVPWFLPPFIPPVHHRHNSCQFLEPQTAHKWRRSKSAVTCWQQSPETLTMLPQHWDCRSSPSPAPISSSVPQVWEDPQNQPHLQLLLLS